MYVSSRVRTQRKHYRHFLEALMEHYERDDTLVFWIGPGVMSSNFKRLSNALRKRNSNLKTSVKTQIKGNNALHSCVGPLHPVFKSTFVLTCSYAQSSANGHGKDQETYYRVSNLYACKSCRPCSLLRDVLRTMAKGLIHRVDTNYKHEAQRNFNRCVFECLTAV